jgi:predicted nucleic acid-binding protein
MTSTSNSTTPGILVTDTNILINFIHVRQLGLLGRLLTRRIAIPEQVIAEITWEAQVKALSAAIDANHLDTCELGDAKTRSLFMHLRGQIEDGEAACIAIAFMRGHAVATDEKRSAERIAKTLLGETRLLRTEDVFLCCINDGLITVAEADEFKAALAEKRYVMGFSSFADLMPA